MSKITWLILILLGIILALVIFSNTLFKSDFFPTTTIIPTPTAGLSATPTFSPGAVRPNITVLVPKLNQDISNPVTISGTARVFENVLNYRLKDTSGKILATGQTTASSPDVGQFGPYSVEVKYDSPTTQYGYIEVYSLSAKDGQEINLVPVYVKFSR